MVPPFTDVAVNVTLVPEQIVVALAEILTLAVNVGLTVILMLFDVAGEPVKHGVALLVKTTVTAALLFNAVVVNVALLVPAFTPFTFHWYAGVVPPLLAVALNVTLVPAQIVVALAEILTLAVNVGLTVMLMLFDVAGEPVKHSVALLVKTTVTASLLFSAVVVNVALLVPAFTPFTFH